MNKKFLKILHLISIFFISLILFSCKTTTNIDVNTKIDYSNENNWLQISTNSLKEIDVFYTYPTVWHKENPNEPNICEIDNTSMIIGAEKAFNSQARVFETVANIYAPYYRQADAKYALSLTEEDRWDLIKSIPSKDIISAFDYFIKNYNNNKPFILVGHSQGSQVLMILLEEYMKENPSVYNRMVCAYIIGYPVTQEYIEKNNHLKFAQGETDTNVIISYNTQSKNIEYGNNIIVGENKALVINPINWKRDETIALASENLGSNLMKKDGKFTKVQNFADAQIDLEKGVIICSSVDEKEMYNISSIFNMGIYHVFDFPFYYYNLRENAKKRASSFLFSNK